MRKSRLVDSGERVSASRTEPYVVRSWVRMSPIFSHFFFLFGLNQCGIALVYIESGCLHSFDLLFPQSYLFFSEYGFIPLDCMNLTRNQEE